MLVRWICDTQKKTSLSVILVFNILKENERDDFPAADGWLPPRDRPNDRDRTPENSDSDDQPQVRRNDTAFGGAAIQRDPQYTLGDSDADAEDEDMLVCKPCLKRSPAFVHHEMQPPLVL